MPVELISSIDMKPFVKGSLLCFCLTAAPILGSTPNLDVLQQVCVIGWVVGCARSLTILQSTIDFVCLGVEEHAAPEWARVMDWWFLCTQALQQVGLVVDAFLMLSSCHACADACG